MKKLEQWSAAQAEQELRTALKQLEHNTQEIYAHSRRNPKVQDLCLALHNTSLSVQDWLGHSGTVKIVVAWQPELLDYDMNDNGYSLD
jgi:hypothetical protein